jgi:hypothetical protein
MFIAFDEFGPEVLDLVLIGQHKRVNLTFPACDCSELLLEKLTGRQQAHLGRFWAGRAMVGDAYAARLRALSSD